MKQTLDEEQRQKYLQTKNFDSECRVLSLEEEVKKHTEQLREKKNEMLYLQDATKKQLLMYDIALLIELSSCRRSSLEEQMNSLKVERQGLRQRFTQNRHCLRSLDEGTKSLSKNIRQELEKEKKQYQSYVLKQAKWEESQRSQNFMAHKLQLEIVSFLDQSLLSNSVSERYMSLVSKFKGKLQTCFGKSKEELNSMLSELKKEKHKLESSYDEVERKHLSKLTEIELGDAEWQELQKKAEKVKSVQVDEQNVIIKENIANSLQDDVVKRLKDEILRLKQTNQLKMHELKNSVLIFA